MKFSIAFAALAIAVQSNSYLRYGSSYTAPAPAPAPTKSAPKNTCNLPNEEVGASGYCKCKDGFVRRQNLCVKQPLVVCQKYQTPVDGQCVCINGFSRNEYGICVTKLQCGSFEHPDPNNRSTCKCDLGYERESKLEDAACVRECRDFEIRNAAGSCVCKAPLLRDPYGNCVVKPEEIVCQDNAHYTYAGCKCDEGFVARGKECVEICDTAAGYTLFPDGNCERCDGENEVAGKHQCVCIPGFYKNASGWCVNDVVCGDNEYKNHYGACDCVKDTYRNSRGFCRPIASK